MNRRPSNRLPDDGPSQADIERFSDVTQKCPNCGKQLYDDVEICWNCGHALTAGEKPMKAVWIAAVVFIIGLAFVLAYFL